MKGIFVALYFIAAPPSELLILTPPTTTIAAHTGQKYLRWLSSGKATVEHRNQLLATLSAPAKLVVDFQDPGFLRISIEPNVADNALFYAPDANQIFVNTRKLNCRIEGNYRRAFYPILNNREPCER